jgi:hypothetical protein
MVVLPFFRISVSSNASNRPTGQTAMDHETTTKFDKSTFLGGARLSMVPTGDVFPYSPVVSIHQPELTSMSPAANQDGAITDRQAKQPIVEFALLQ